MAHTTIPQINHSRLSQLVADGRIFSVQFTKRSTGELRQMVCRIGVQKHLKGGSIHYDPKARNLLCVFDMKHQGYRSIPIENIQRLTVSGQTFAFNMEV